MRGFECARRNSRICGQAHGKRACEVKRCRDSHVQRKLWRAMRSALASLGFWAGSLGSTSVTAQRPLVWRLTPSARIAQDGPQGTHAFTRILSVLPASDGSVVIADAANLEISVFSRDGAFLRGIGRAGQGPGEFGRVSSVGLLNDTLWVNDARLQRATLFTLGGEILATIRREPGSSQVGRPTVLLTAGMAIGSPAADRRGLKRDVTPVILMDRAGHVRDTLAWVPSKNSDPVMLARPEGGFTIGRQPFPDTGLAIVSWNARRLFIVDRSVATTVSSAAFRIVALELNGDTLWNRRYAYMPRRLEEAPVDSFLRAAERVLTPNGHSRDDIRRAVFIPEYYSPVTSGFASADGFLWLRREEGRATVDYWIVDQSGELAAMLIVPANLMLMAAASSEVWGVQKDEYDVPSVIRYDIIGRVE